MFVLISLVKENSDFSEEKHFFIQSNLRKGYEGVFQRRVFLGEKLRGGIHHGDIWQVGIFRGEVPKATQPLSHSLQ